MQENASEVLTQRERNQRETWNAIHDAAYTFAREEGLAAATAEAVVARAGVSRRTFFNYFPTKEDAVLGTRLPRLDEAVVERLATAQEDELTRVVHAFVSVLRTALTQETAVRRREIIAQHPSLRGRLAQLIGQVEELVREAMQKAAEKERPPQGSPSREEDGVGAGESQEVLLLLSGVIIKHAFTRYYEGQGAAGESGAEEDRAEESGARMEAFLQESIALFCHVIGRSSRGAAQYSAPRLAQEGR